MTNRAPGSLMRLWAGYMELPGKHGGPALAFADYSLNETHHDPPMLERAGLRAEWRPGTTARCSGLVTVIGLYRAWPEILEVIRLLNPRAWVQIPRRSLYR